MTGYRIPVGSIHHERDRLLIKGDHHATIFAREDRRTCKSLARSTAYYVFSGLVVAVLIVGALHPLLSTSNKTFQVTSRPDMPSEARNGDLQVPLCNDEPCFRPGRIVVPANREGFPSYWDYAAPMNVTFDKRSLRINDDRALFLSGSMHPSRATLATWNLALDEAVRNGLNMITIYIMWSAHQPFADRPLDWTLPGNLQCESDYGDCTWTLAYAIRQAASRGLFVHIRVGPYVCAEYSYGGIPEWVPIKYPDMDMRRPDRNWLDLMSNFVNETVAYLRENKLWAYQGGPILLAQIENELGGDMEVAPTTLKVNVTSGEFVDADTPLSASIRNATLQDYANWCGSFAQQLEPNVTWTMCNGLSANDTIDTFNGDYFVTQWLESHGDSGQIQVTQPALFTEDEGGFQIWGDEPSRPSDYYWGRTARGMAYNALQWFARGGSHLNYYMWWGAYNRGRQAAAGIMNMYASDAVLCPCGQRRQPKYDHLEALHQAIISVAPILLNSPSALFKNESIEIMDDLGFWETGSHQSMFTYTWKKNGRGMKRQATFVENNANVSRVVKVALQSMKNPRIFEMAAYSAVLFLDGTMTFDSAALDAPSLFFERKMTYDPVQLLDWVSWAEPIGASEKDEYTLVGPAPVEQTSLLVESFLSSDYTWYETDLVLDSTLLSSKLVVSTSQANALVVYIGNRLVGSADTHHHKEGAAELVIYLGTIKPGKNKLAILSESIGYGNLIGRWGGSTRGKQKGLIGPIVLVSETRNESLVDGRVWRSYPGLHGEQLARGPIRRSNLQNRLSAGQGKGGLWSSALFDSPRYDSSTQGLFLDILTGRGHVWLNGVDLGRYWNLTRGDTDEYSQRYYYLPNDLLYMDGELNEVVFFDVFDGNYRGPRLVISWIEPSDDERFEDQVGFLASCL